MKDDGVASEHVDKSHNAKSPSEDPFGIYDILNRKPDNSNHKSDDPTFPPGFTPADENVIPMNSKDDSNDKPKGDFQSNKERQQFKRVENNNVPISDSFDGYRGTWFPTATKLLIVSVYAPQEVSERRLLWEYIGSLIEQWEGECVILGDFNEVRTEQERYGTVFNALGANIFNHFIASANLVDLPLEGYSFTWAHKSAAKMSKLDRFLISEGENIASAQRTAFINRLVEAGIKFLDQVRWSIEGDENSKYFHGILNKKRSQLAIRGVLVDGDWIDDPANVKNEFFKHFSNRFSKPPSANIRLDSQMFRTLSSEQVEDMERNVSYDEVKRAIWDCGTNKSPGPDGFTFDFIRRYWYVIDKDVVKAVEEFFYSSSFPPGCNASFITLIPKKQDAKLVKDFRPISLIGCIYKIVSKILANRLSMVISDLVSDVTICLVSNRQILDGPFLNITNFYRRSQIAKKTKAIYSKVDFEKAFEIR
ncbi:RNA-directed DNA polymerase, eukaryota [Tanacetum coccineum]